MKAGSSSALTLQPQLSAQHADDCLHLLASARGRTCSTRVLQTLSKQQLPILKPSAPG